MNFAMSPSAARGGRNQGTMADKGRGRLLDIRRSQHAIGQAVLSGVTSAPAVALTGISRLHARHRNLTVGQLVLPSSGSVQASSNHRQRQARLGMQGRAGLEGVDRSLPIGPEPAINAVPPRGQRIQALAERPQGVLPVGQVKMHRSIARAAKIPLSGARGWQHPEQAQ